MSENLDSDPTKEAQAKLLVSKLVESGVDIETIQKLMQTATINSADTSPALNEDDEPKTEDLVQEGSGPYESENESEEPSPDDFAAASKETGNVNDDLTDESKLDEFENYYEDEDEKPAAEEGFTGQTLHIETATGSNVNQDQGSFSKINKSDQSQAALPVSQSPSALATNMGALHVHQTAHIVEKSDAATQVMPSDQSAVEFDSVVPAIFLPLSKVGLYLPEGKILADIDASIPLPYKAMLVLKNQTAAIVFGYNESDKTENYGGKTLGEAGMCGECGKSLGVENNPFFDSIEGNMSSNSEEVNVDVRQKNVLLKRPGVQGALSDMQEQQQQPFLHQPFLHQPLQGQPQSPQGQPQLLSQPQLQSHPPPQSQQPPLQGQPPQLQSHPLSQSQQPPLQGQPPQLQSYPPPQSQQPPLQGQQRQQMNQPTPNQQFSSPITRRSSVPPNFQGSAGYIPQYPSANSDSINPQKKHLPGLQPPVWAKDEEAKSCLHCGKMFTVTRRKHHCRGCGKIYCSDCCNQLAQLPYLEYKISRICINCTLAIRKARAEKVKRQQQGIQSATPPTSAPSSSSVSISNGALLFIPPAQVNNSAMENSEPQNRTSNFMLPKTETDTAYSASAPATNFMPDPQPTQGAQASLPRAPSQIVNSPYQPQTAVDSALAFGYNESIAPAMLAAYDSASRDYLNVLKAPLRPAGRTVTWTDNNESRVGVDSQSKRFKNISKELKNTEGVLVQAAVELSVRIKKIQVVVKQGLHEAWFLRSYGFKSCGQKEIAFLLEKRINEDVFPFEMLKIYRTLYSITLNQGERFNHGNYIAFSSGLLGNEDNKGFLFVTSSMVPKLVQQYSSGEPLLYGILVKQSELPCAKYLPTRLLIALGVQQQCYPCPALSSRDRPSVYSIVPNELFFSTFVTLNRFLNHKTPQALIPGVHILKSGGKVVLELPFAYQTEVISIFDSLFVDEDKPVTIPIAGDMVLDASGHFTYSPSTSAQRGFVVLQNNNNQEGPGNQYLAFSSILLVLTFGEASSSRTAYGVEVIEDGIKVTLAGSQAREIRQAFYQGTNCSMYVGNADCPDQFLLRWTSDSGGSIVSRPKTIMVRQESRGSTKGFPPASNSLPARNIGGQTNVIIDRVKTREIEMAIRQKIIGNPEEVVRKLENDVRQACVGSLLTFANRLLPNAEKNLNLTLCLRPGYKKWGLGPTNQPINLARSLQFALGEIEVPETNEEIVLVFNVTLQKRG